MDLVESKYGEHIHGEMLVGEERRKFAFDVVNTAIDIYINGRVHDYTPLQHVARLVPAVATIFPQSTLSWPDRHRVIAELLYRSAMRLGGLPLKAMQFVGLRDDLPMGYQEWFAKAQEESNLKTSEADVQQILSGFGSDLQWAYEPLKSASIAQVHLSASWKGQEAVVKVQHLNVRSEFLGDLRIMQELAVHVDTHDEARGASSTLFALAHKLRPTVEAETNFTIEAQNQMKVRQALQGMAIVPEVLAATENALVMKRLPGMTAAQAIQAWKNGEKLDVFGRAQRDAIYKVFAKMIIRDSFFQMDSHPGNIMAMTGANGTGTTIGLLDFGQCCEATPEQQRLFKAFAAGAPACEGQATDPSRNAEWLKELGIQVGSPEEAQAAADLLFFGRKSKMFPDTKAINPELMPLLLVVLYLGRFENQAVELRKAVGFHDEANPFAVLQAFRSQL